MHLHSTNRALFIAIALRLPRLVLKEKWTCAPAAPKAHLHKVHPLHPSSLEWIPWDSLHRRDCLLGRRGMKGNSKTLWYPVYGKLGNMSIRTYSSFFVGHSIVPIIIILCRRSSVMFSSWWFWKITHSNNNTKKNVSLFMTKTTWHVGPDGLVV